MSTRERPIDRGSARGAYLVGSVGSEIRLARRNLGLSLRCVADEVGISPAELARIERALAPWVSVTTLARICAVVGLELAVKAYPGGRPVRDARHSRLLSAFQRLISKALTWSTEVPLLDARDSRAWDAAIGGQGWRYGVEAELNPLDGQALLRRLALKRRDGGMDGLILLLPDTRQTRRFRREYATLIVEDYPISGAQALRSLRTGESPGGNAVVVLG